MGAPDGQIPSIVVSNTGPILHLAEIDSWNLLRPLNHVQIPPAVDAELVRLCHAWPTQRPDWIDTQLLEAAPKRNAEDWLNAGLLHRGEAEALALAHHRKATWFLTDDTAARFLAKSQGLEVHGTLGILLWNAAMGIITKPDALTKLANLRQSSLWLSAKVMASARDALEQMVD